MKSWAYVVDADGARETGLNEAEAARGPDSFVWFHLDGRQQSCRDWLHDRTDLPETVTASMVAFETRPRAEPIGDGALINLRGLGSEPDDGEDPLVSIRIWADQGRAITVSLRDLAAMEPVCTAVAAGKVRDPGDLITLIATEITQALDPEIAALGDTVDDCEEGMEPSEVFTMRRMIAKARAEAIAYRRFVSPQRQALDRLAGLDAPWLEDSDRLHLGTAADRFARMAEELEAVRERAALLHEQLTDLRAEQTETRTLILSIVALVFLPLTFLTGLLGMNVEGIPYAKAPWAFWGVVAICVLIAVAVVGWFTRKQWFRR